MRRIKKKKIRPVTHDQWIEIARKDGKTVCTFYPPNAEFERLRHELDPPPVLIYRRLNFINGVPREYEWTNPTVSVRQFGGHYLHRLTIDEWLSALEQERHEGNVRVVFRRGQPRPPEFGPCPCDRCTAEREAAYAND